MPAEVPAPVPAPAPAPDAARFTRRPDWAQRLSALLCARADHPFAWGANDCCAHVAAAVIAMTDRDPMAGLRDYRCASSARRMLARTKGVDGWLDGLFPRVPVGLARRGDVGVIATPLGLAAVIVDGAVLRGAGPEGAIAAPRAALLTAWKVG